MEHILNDGTLLQKAASLALHQTSLLLEENGADPRKWDFGIWNLLYDAVLFPDSQHPSNLQNTLKSALKDFSLNIPIQDAGKYIQDAAKYLEVAGVLLDEGAEPDARDLDNWTPLHEAAFFGYSKGFDKLLEGRGRTSYLLLEARDNHLWTPLHVAAALGHTTIVTTVLETGLQSQWQMRFTERHLRRNPLHLALEQGHLKTVNVLFCNSFGSSLGPFTDNNYSLVRTNLLQKARDDGTKKLLEIFWAEGKRDCDAVMVNSF